MVKIKNIIIGWYKFLFKKQSPMAKERLEICKFCMYNEDGWCGICGCKLSAKAEVKDEKCAINKW